MMKKKDALSQLSSDPVSSFFEGLFLPFRGLGFLMKRPKLWTFIIIPLIINTILFVLALGFGFSAFSDLVKDLMENTQDTWYWSSLAVLAKALFWVLALILVYFIFTPLALVIAAPFNDYLAEIVEKNYGMAIRDERPLLKTLKEEVFFAVKSEVKRMIFFGGVFILLLPLNLLPLIGGIIYIILSGIWGCFGFAYEFISFASDRRHLKQKQKLSLLRTNTAHSLGFGAATFFLMMVPFINILAVSISAVSGTILFCALKKNSDPEHRFQNSTTD